MKKISLTSKIFIGFGLGILLGIIFKEKILFLKPIGDIFLKLIKMIVVPLILCSLVSGIASIGDVNKLKRIGGKTIAYFIITTLISGCIGLGVANIIKPGGGFNLSEISTSSTQDVTVETTNTSFLDTIVNMFPDNMVNSLSEGNLIQIIIVSLFIGVALASLNGKVENIKKSFEEFTEVMYKITGMVMELSPIGVTALIAASIGQYGLEVFGPLAKFIVTDYIGMILVIIILYLFMLKFIAKVKLKTFFRKIMKIWAVTASTTSSSGTLPVSIKVSQDDFNVSEEISSFVLPLGATMNMNGAVVYYAALVVFVSQIYGINLPIIDQIMLIIIATLISVGSAGIPGGGIVMSVLLLTTMGLPTEIVGLIAGMYRVLDMGHTTLNVTGDIVTTLCIARAEDGFDASKVIEY